MTKNSPTEIVGAISLGTVGFCLAWALSNGRGIGWDLAFLFFALLYFLPLIVACQRQHANALGVGLVNFFFGWSLVGWVAALVWAVRAEKT